MGTSPELPSGALASVIVTLGFGWIATLTVVVTGFPLPLSACTVKVEVPALLGLPLSVPSGASVAQIGRVPDASVTVGVPVVANVNEYGSHTSPGGGVPEIVGFSGRTVIVPSAW